jgi:hypothetical protein
MIQMLPTMILPTPPEAQLLVPPPSRTTTIGTVYHYFYLSDLQS